MRRTKIDEEIVKVLKEFPNSSAEFILTRIPWKRDAVRRALCRMRTSGAIKGKHTVRDLRLILYFVPEVEDGICSHAGR